MIHFDGDDRCVKWIRDAWQRIDDRIKHVGNLLSNINKSGIDCRKASLCWMEFCLLHTSTPHSSRVRMAHNTFFFAFLVFCWYHMSLVYSEMVRIHSEFIIRTVLQLNICINIRAMSTHIALASLFFGRRKSVSPNFFVSSAAGRGVH